jgi:hypothetical protein
MSKSMGVRIRPIWLIFSAYFAIAAYGDGDAVTGFVCGLFLRHAFDFTKKEPTP